MGPQIMNVELMCIIITAGMVLVVIAVMFSVMVIGFVTVTIITAVVFAGRKKCVCTGKHNYYSIMLG